jgi:MYXO-CTERM domain-containing protein
MESWLRRKPMKILSLLKQRLSAPIICSALIFPTLALAAPILVTPLDPPSQTISEGQSLVMHFQVTNTDPVNSYILDYAMATITTTGDPTDSLVFTGVNGSTGLGNFCLTLTPAGTPMANCTFTYNTTTDAGEPGPPQDAKNVFAFQIEMSPTGNGVNAPNPLVGANVLLRNNGNGINVAVANNLLGPNPVLPCPNGLPCANLLYPTTGILGLEADGTTSPSLRTIFVSDTPEPSSILTSTAALLLLGASLLWRRRPIA